VESVCVESVSEDAMAERMMTQLARQGCKVSNNE